MSFCVILLILNSLFLKLITFRSSTVFKISDLKTKMPLNPQQTESVNKWINEVERLRVHAKVERLPLSKTISDMISYCVANMQEDALIAHVKENPFKEKRMCIIL